MSLRFLLTAILGCSLLGATASAQTTTPVRRPSAAPASIDQRMQQQLARIRRGVQSGQITPAERRRLLSREAEIRTHVREIRQSGRTLNPADRQQVIRSLNRMNAAIVRASRR